MNSEEQNEEQNKVKCICEGIRRGLQRVVTEPLPRHIEELVRILQHQEQSAPSVCGQAPGSR
jgi:carbamate kinase